MLFLVSMGSIDVMAAKARCSQFESQGEAQAYMDAHSAYYLDRDNDGEACECLPGGSKHGHWICFQ